jgi:hypothetical protein
VLLEVLRPVLHKMAVLALLVLLLFGNFPDLYLYN